MCCVIIGTIPFPSGFVVSDIPRSITLGHCLRQQNPLARGLFLKQYIAQILNVLKKKLLSEWDTSNTDQWWIQGAPRTPPPIGSNSFIFMHFLSPPGKSWIRHWRWQHTYLRRRPRWGESWHVLLLLWIWTWVDDRWRTSAPHWSHSTLILTPRSRHPAIRKL